MISPCFLDLVAGIANLVTIGIKLNPLLPLVGLLNYLATSDEEDR